MNFSAARERIAAARPDLLVSDVDLGTETAMEELPRLSAEGGSADARGLRVPRRSGRGAAPAVPEVLDTLPKPFEFSDLEDRIRRRLEDAAGIVGAAETSGDAVAPEPAEVPARAVDGASSSAAPPSTVEPEPEDDDGWVEIGPR